MLRRLRESGRRRGRDGRWPRHEPYLDVLVKQVFPFLFLKDHCEKGRRAIGIKGVGLTGRAKGFLRRRRRGEEVGDREGRGWGTEREGGGGPSGETRKTLRCANAGSLSYSINMRSRRFHLLVCSVEASFGATL